ncbi:hypothetical protein LTS16_026444 [Friedmanniomyces endolithicus]|nr:hypothetical protein LTR57_024521 [Friedmanniomyces endolithicus]KAK0951601.1 hypothetical protein LTS01_025181 [Friedmanniomyces endolithicus]KAK1021533.1 hypothetical protein LTS16_026444 [Friedmanniomyces endolithicus]
MMHFSTTAFTAVAASLLTFASASTLTSPVLPSIVRNPYLSTWLANAREEPWTAWPMLYTGQSVGLAVLASVPSTSTVYPLHGRTQDSLDGSASQYNVSFPDFDLDIYIDVNGQWVSGNRGSEIEWSLAETDHADGKHLKTWRVKRREEQPFTEWADQAEWGTLHFPAPADVSHEAGTSGLLRQRFSRNSTLQNAVDSELRGIMEEEPVFVFSKHINLSSRSDDANTSSVNEASVLFTLAHIQDPVVQFASARGLTWMPSDSPTTTSTSKNSTNYLDIAALSARQVLGATSFSDTPQNPILFLKEMRSNGNSQIVDVIFPAFPFFPYTNPGWLAYLLEPLLEHILSGQYPNLYTMHDPGTHFPKMTDHVDGNDEYMPV